MRLGHLFDQYSLYIVPFMATLMVVILSFTVLFPKIGNIRDHLQIRGAKDTQLNQLVIKRKLLESMTSEESQKLYKEAEKALPQEKDAASVLTTLESVAAKTQFTLDNVSFAPGRVSTGAAQAAANTDPAATQKKADAETIFVSVSGRGTTAQFHDFIKLLESSRRLTDLESVTFSYTQEQPDFLIAKFSLGAYYLLPITEIGSVDSQLPQITTEEQAVVAKVIQYPYVSETEQIPISGPGLGKTDLFSQ